MSCRCDCLFVVSSNFEQKERVVSQFGLYEYPIIKWPISIVYYGIRFKSIGVWKFIVNMWLSMDRKWKRCSIEHWPLSLILKRFPRKPDIQYASQGWVAVHTYIGWLSRTITRSLWVLRGSSEHDTSQRSKASAITYAWSFVTACCDRDSKKSPKQIWVCA